VCLPSLTWSATFDVREYGARGDGKTLNTYAIQKAIEAASMGYGNTVLFPAGKYLTGPFNLTSGMVLSLDKDAVILGVQDTALYGIIPPFPSYGVGRDVGPDNYEPVIGGYHLKNVVITGGTIDGQGDYWWNLYKSKNLKHSRPALVEFQNCSGLTLKSTILQNSPFWTLHPIYCMDVYIADVVILAPSDSPNTDGIDVDSSEKVLIERVNISNGDDMIAIKSGMNMAGINFGIPTTDVMIRDSVFSNGHGLSIGSETSGGIRNVTFQNLTVTSAKAGPRIKTSRGRGGVIQDIFYKNITILGCDTDAMDVGMNYDNIPDPGNKTTTPILKNVLLSDITGHCSNPGKFVCLPESPCTGFQLKNINISQTTRNFQCQYITGTSTNVTPISCVIE